MQETITSRKNPLIAHVRQLLSSRSARREAGEFAGDGEKLLEEAVRWGAELTAVLYTPQARLPALPDTVRQVLVPEDVMQSVSPMKSPQGALFLGKIPKTTPPERLSGRWWLVLDGLQDPGNVGTIWRTADALGADGLLLVNRCADPWGHKTVRATMGACFRLPAWELEPAELSGLLERSGLPLYAAALGEHTEDIRTLDGGRCALAVGSEGQGLSPEVLALSKTRIVIPMRERCESLNAAAAAAILLWELARRD